MIAYIYILCCGMEKRVFRSSIWAIVYIYSNHNWSYFFLSRNRDYFPSNKFLHFCGYVTVLSTAHEPFPVMLKNLLRNINGYSHIFYKFCRIHVMISSLISYASSAITNMIYDWSVIIGSIIGPTLIYHFSYLCHLRKHVIISETSFSLVDSSSDFHYYMYVIWLNPL